MLAHATTLLVAALHIVFMVFETFLWTKPAVRRRFGQTAEQAEQTKILAANQGVYNGALAGALIWSVYEGNVATTRMLLVFVIVVGLYGGATAKRSILVIQALPAALALGATML